MLSSASSKRHAFSLEPETGCFSGHRCVAYYRARLFPGDSWAGANIRFMDERLQRLLEDERWEELGRSIHAELPQGDLDELLFCLMFHQQPGLVERLLALGANPNQPGFWGDCFPNYTALTVAEAPSLVRTLIGAGALVKVECCGEVHSTSVHEACENGQLERLRVLVEEGDGELAFECPDYIGRYPLHVAAAEGRAEVVGYLIERGVDVNAICEEKIGETAVAWALMNGHVDVARLLIRHGADPTLAIGLNSPPIQPDRLQEWLDAPELDVSS